MYKYLLIILSLVLNSLLVHAETTTNNGQTSPPDIDTLPQYQFYPTESLPLQVQQTLDTAKANQQLAIFVLGAQWCHDSQGLAKNFSTPQMQKILTSKYQVLFVDVGYLEKGFELVKQFNRPIYYGTPTVMVVDPLTNKLLNQYSMKKWLNAYQVPLNEYEEYFTALAENETVQTSTSEQMQVYMLEIDAFEQQQALRLKKAYQVISPLLKAYMKSDDTVASKNFVDKWQPVQKYRYKIQSDIKSLIAQAKSNIEAGTNEPLILPTYAEFAWE